MAARGMRRRLARRRGRARGGRRGGLCSSQLPWPHVPNERPQVRCPHSRARCSPAKGVAALKTFFLPSRACCPAAARWPRGLTTTILQCRHHLARERIPPLGLRVAIEGRRAGHLQPGTAMRGSEPEVKGSEGARLASAPSPAGGPTGRCHPRFLQPQLVPTWHAPLPGRRRRCRLAR